MSEKLDLFELSVKRGLENYEAPMEEGAWNQFQAHMNTGAGSATGGSNGSSFLSKFGAAAAILTAVGLFINYSTDFRQEHLVIESIEHIESTSASDIQEVVANKETTYVVNSPSELSAEEALSIESEKLVEAALPKQAEEKRILNINKKLQAAADRAEIEAEDLEKKTTTRYVGKNFNLGAASEFSPNGDGIDDIFLPAALTADSRFTMTVTNSNGKRVFSSKSSDRPWNGMDLAGNPSAQGHYSWEVIVHKDNNNKDIFRGVVRLDR